MASAWEYVVDTDFGLEWASADAVAPGEDDIPTNLMPGTEYAKLNPAQAAEYARGEGQVRLEDDRRIGAFTLVFFNPPSEAQSQII